MDSNFFVNNSPFIIIYPVWPPYVRRPHLFDTVPFRSFVLGTTVLQSDLANFAVSVPNRNFSLGAHCLRTNLTVASQDKLLSTGTASGWGNRPVAVIGAKKNPSDRGVAGTGA